MRFVLTVCLVVLLLQSGCRKPEQTGIVNTSKSAKKDDSANSNSSPKSDVGKIVNFERIRDQVDAFCGDCHVTPPASSFPRNAWRKEVDRGFQFYLEAARTDLEIPIRNEVTQYYESLAPQKLDVALQKISPCKKFEHENVLVGETARGAIAYVTWYRLLDEKKSSIVYCDMRENLVGSFDPESGKHRVLTTARNPCRIVPVDIDSDGHQDLVIAELASVAPADHDKGRVSVIRWDNQKQSYRERETILDNLGRVADVQGRDLDEDGDIDLAVSEFGWLETGSVFWLENTGITDNQSLEKSFKRHELDSRHGAINVPIVDINKDGKPDILTLLSQEYEVIIAYINQGKGKFKTQQLYSADDPAFGSSNMEVVDLDQDGDLDLIYANGDTFDSYYVKPYHGIRWLENNGKLQFTAHEIQRMPGVHKVAVSDFDADGDLDLVACSLLPKDLLDKSEKKDLPSVVLFTNDSEQNFSASLLEEASCNHASTMFSDINTDGKIDVVVGNFNEPGKDRSRLTVFYQK